MDSRWLEYVRREGLYEASLRAQTLIDLVKRHTPPGGRVIEVGCGSARISYLLSEMGYRLTGIDLDGEIVDWLKRNPLTAALDIRRMDMMQPAFPDGSFDTAFSDGVLEHHGDGAIVRALREQGRIARRVIVDVPNARYGKQDFGDERLLSVRHWKRLIGEAGLELVESTGRHFPRWVSLLPKVAVSRRCAWFAERVGTCSVFVCAPKAAV